VPGQGAAGGLLAARAGQAEQQRRARVTDAGQRAGEDGVALQLGGQPGQVLGAGVVLQPERDLPAGLGPGAQAVRVGQPVPVTGRDKDPVLVAAGRLGLVQPFPQFPAACAGVRGQGGEEPVAAGHLGKPLGAFQRELPVRADLRRPLLLVPVFGAEQRGADWAEQVVPRRGPGLRVRAEPA
jgi:hypothetical protein